MSDRNKVLSTRVITLDLGARCTVQLCQCPNFRLHCEDLVHAFKEPRANLAE